MDSRLTEVLVCPQCKGPLSFSREKSELQCAKCALGFLVADDIPQMIIRDARHLTAREAEKARVRPPLP